MPAPCEIGCLGIYYLRKGNKRDWVVGVEGGSMSEVLHGNIGIDRME